jgi:hypothetical protein
MCATAHRSVARSPKHVPAQPDARGCNRCPRGRSCSNNAGIGGGVPLTLQGAAGRVPGGEVLTEAQRSIMYAANWERNMSINLQAQVTLSQLLLPSLMRHGEGRIVNVASTEGQPGHSTAVDTICSRKYVAHPRLGCRLAGCLAAGMGATIFNSACELLHTRRSRLPVQF